MASDPTDSAQPSILQDPLYRRYILGRIASWVALQIISVAVGWQIYAITHSTFALGMVGLAQYLPMVVLALVVGHAADRFPRRRIVLLCQATYAVACVALTAATFTHHLNEAGVYALLALVGTARAFDVPAAQSLVPRLVEADQTAPAVTLYSSCFQLASILGPALGGFLYALGAEVPYALGAALALTAAALTHSVRPRFMPAMSGEAEGSLFSGAAFVWSNKKILGATTLDLFVVLLGGAVALMPAYARDLLHTGPWGLGLLRLAPSLGAVLASALFARRMMRRRAGMQMFVATIVFALATIAFASSRSLWLSIFVLMILGGADIVSVVIRGALVQIETPDPLRGRVTAVNALFVGTSDELGQFESGVTAAWFGLVPATILGGCLSLAVTFACMGLFPELRKLDRLR
jgi:MFS family permease